MGGRALPCSLSFFPISLAAISIQSVPSPSHPLEAILDDLEDPAGAGVLATVPRAAAAPTCSEAPVRNRIRVFERESKQISPSHLGVSALTSLALMGVVLGLSSTRTTLSPGPNRPLLLPPPKSSSPSWPGRRREKKRLEFLWLANLSFRFY